jgi:hypothetical protein
MKRWGCTIDLGQGIAKLLMRESQSRNVRLQGFANSRKVNSKTGVETKRSSEVIRESGRLRCRRHFLGLEHIIDSDSMLIFILLVSCSSIGHLCFDFGQLCIYVVAFRRLDCGWKYRDFV